MNVTKPILIKNTLAIQTWVNNHNTELNENPTNSGASDTRSDRKTNRCGLHIKNSFLHCKECLNAVKPAYNKITRDWKFFFIAGRLHLIWVFEDWILRTQDLWEGIKVFQERQISVLPGFSLTFWRRNYFFNFSTLCI